MNDACKACGLPPETRAELIRDAAEAEAMKVAFMDEGEFEQGGPSGKDKMQALYWLLQKYASQEDEISDEATPVVLEVPSNGRGPTNVIDVKPK